MGGFLFATIMIIICLVVLDQIVYFLKGESTFIETQLSMQQQWQRQKKNCLAANSNKLLHYPTSTRLMQRLSQCVCKTKPLDIALSRGAATPNNKPGCLTLSTRSHHTGGEQKQQCCIMSYPTLDHEWGLDAPDTS